MSKMKDASETLSTPDKEVLKLQREIEHLQQENKVLHIRAQGVQVLGKVLQDSQENNAKLKHEVEQLKSHLVEKGLDLAQADLSVCTVNDEDLQTAVAKQSGSQYSSLAKSSIGNHDYVNVTTVSGPPSLSAGFPSLLPGDFHIKEINVEFQHITCELDLLIKEAQSLQESVERLPENERDTEIQGKLTRLFPKLNEYAKQSRTRETLSSALASEEEQMRTKLAAMEEEQASHENVVQELKDKLDKSKEEIAQIQSEMKFFQEAVVVKRQHKSVLTNRQLSSISSEQSAAASTSDESIIVKMPLSQSGPETCEGCIQLQRQTTELQRQLLATKAEKDEALKLKEEILDVNHKWDAQYKMLVAATNKEISDLKYQVQVVSSPDRRTGQFPEPTMMEKRMLEQRCKQLENELQQKQLEVNHLQLLMRNQSGHMSQYQQPRTPQSPSMEQQPSHTSLLGAAALPTRAPAAAPAQGPPSWPGTTPYSQQIPPEVIDQIEVLKQQLRVYADDFATEREDRERNQAEKEKMREELNAVREQVQALEQQVQIYEEDFKREKREKESLQQQLRTNYTGGGGYQYQDPLTERARAIAEQQARVQAIKEVHDRERDRLLRGQQELQQHVYAQPQGSYSRAQSQYNPYGRGLDYTTQEWQRQNNLVPRGSYPTRGPVAHPASQRSNANSMYHGGEVLPDRVEDVVDSPADGNDNEEAEVSDKEVIQLEECPRCLRRFDGEDSDAILKHIERCIS